MSSVCPPLTSCQPGTNGIASTQCNENESCQAQGPKKGLSAGDIAAIILGILLLGALLWIAYKLFKRHKYCSVDEFNYSIKAPANMNQQQKISFLTDYRNKFAKEHGLA